MTRRLILALTASLLLGHTLPAQEAAEERREGDLQKFIDIDSKDLQTRLEVLQHSLYEVDQNLIAVTFRQLYGDRIRMEPVLFANVDHDLTPGYVFTPIPLDEKK